MDSIASIKDDSSSNIHINRNENENEKNRKNENENENFSEEKNDINRSDEDVKGQSSSYRLLGDLPTLGGGVNNDKNYNREKAKERDLIDKDIKVALNLELPQAGKGGPFGGKKGVLNNDKSPNKNSKTQVDSDIPPEFLCAINSHVMKDPVRSGNSKVIACHDYVVYF
jgi:hypothetical protein